MRIRHNPEDMVLVEHPAEEWNLAWQFRGLPC